MQPLTPPNIPMPFINLEYIYYSITRAVFGDFSGNFFVAIYNRVAYLAEWIVPYSLFVSLVLLAGIVYCFLRIKQIEQDLILERAPVSSVVVATGRMINVRWEKIIAHINSNNESDWRLAILEADLILEEMLISMGYRGETIGEQLQEIEPSDFHSLNEAWEAHKIRNKIVHEGIEYQLSRREARRIISLYEKVFSEFKFI